jgi:Ulp1 family protease
MFLFRAVDMYMVKVIGEHLKDKHRQLKHDTRFCVQQQAPGDTCGFYVCLNMVVFGAQPNCGVSVNAFILLYC